MSGRSLKQEEALLARALQCVEGVVTSFARKYAGLIDEAEAGSEANLAVVEVVRRYDEARDPTFDAYVRSWARGFIMKFVTARTVEQHMERAAQRRWAAALAEEAQAQRHAAEADTPEARYEYAESMRLLDESMPELPRDERVIIEALYFDCMCLNEVEPVLGVSEGTVRRRYARAKRRQRRRSSPGCR
jgi:RNA polymerase sigma factor (sigma-70 family)